MATLGIPVEGAEARRVLLPARLLVGRSPSCFLRLSAAEVSSEHALIQWTGGRWTIRDLGSTNGTYVNGRRLEVGVVGALKAGDEIGFGDPDVPHVLASDAPPIPLAVELQARTVVEADHDLLAIPSAESPEVVAYPGDDGRWVKEVDGERQLATDQEVVYVGGAAWCLFLPEPDAETPLVHAEKTLVGTRFRFEVSRDEEHVVLTLLHGEQETRLEPREHHYVLLLLARARARDAELPEAERGWLDKEELQRMLRMRPNAMNVAIHRARQQLADAGLLGAAGIVQVRRGRRRFGTDRFEERPLA